MLTLVPVRPPRVRTAPNLDKSRLVCSVAQLTSELREGDNNKVWGASHFKCIKGSCSSSEIGEPVIAARLVRRKNSVRTGE